MDLKYSMGLDISKDDIKACLCVIDQTQEVKVISSGDFINTKKGIANLITWFNRNRKIKDLPHTITMEPTGVYYENCVYTLHRAGFRVSVVVATLVKSYLKSLGLKSKNDAIDAKGIATMGAQRKLEEWKPLPANILEIRNITRYHQALQERITSANNQLHALENSEDPSDFVIKQLEESIEFDKQNLKKVSQKLNEDIKADPELKRKFDIVTKIAGIAILSAATVVAEYGGFETFSNHKQVVSFAGYDVVENQSGKHYGKTKISKRGNSRVRRILFMPAFSAAKVKNSELRNLNERIQLKNGDKLKMKGYVAVQKKLLVYIYFAWTKEIDYSKAKILNEEQVTTSPLDFVEVFESQKGKQSVNRKEIKSSHITVAAQGSNPVIYHSITPHRYDKIT